MKLSVVIVYSDLIAVHFTNIEEGFPSLLSLPISQSTLRSEKGEFRIGKFRGGSIFIGGCGFSVAYPANLGKLRASHGTFFHCKSKMPKKFSPDHTLQQATPVPQ